MRPRSPIGPPRLRGLPDRGSDASRSRPIRTGPLDDVVRFGILPPAPMVLSRRFEVLHQVLSRWFSTKVSSGFGGLCLKQPHPFLNCEATPMIRIHCLSITAPHHLTGRHNDRPLLCDASCSTDMRAMLLPVTCDPGRPLPSFQPSSLSPDTAEVGPLRLRPCYLAQRSSRCMRPWLSSCLICPVRPCSPSPNASSTSRAMLCMSRPVPDTAPDDPMARGSRPSTKRRFSSPRIGG
jgi:hypothetical protein